MRHELLELYNLAIESCDADIIRAFQRARERIGPQIIVDVLLENAELRGALEDIAQWTERYTAPGHPVSTVARKALASQPTSHNTDREDEWPPWPRVGKRYLVWFNGVLQHETYEFDRGDDGMGGGEYFWNREDVDECPPFDPDNHRWLALDDIDAARAGEDE